MRTAAVRRGRRGKMGNGVWEPSPGPLPTLALATAALALAPGPLRAQTPPPPVLDVHLHAIPVASQGPPPLAMCTPMVAPRAFDPAGEWGASLLGLFKNPPCADPIWSPTSDDELRERTLAVMERWNVIGVTSGPPELVERWREAAPERIIPGLLINVAATGITPDSLRALHAAGRLEVLGEVTNQYSGVEPSDPRFEPYLALAEELDLPVGIHMGPGPPGAPYLGFTRYRSRLHSPLLLEEVLLQRPTLRVYIMHAGWPMLDDLLALLWAHPQVHVGVGVLVFALPEAEFRRYVKAIVDAGFGKRVLFGSDQMVWPETLERGILRIQEADWLTEEEKRDILYHNAARFLRLTPETVARHHGG